MFKISLTTLFFIIFVTILQAQEIKKDTTKKSRFNIKFGIDIDTGFYNIKKPQKTIGFGKAKDSTTKDSLVDQILPYEKLAKKKYTLIRRAFQNTVSNYNYLFNAKEELNNLIENERNNYEDDPSDLISFYDYSLDQLSKKSIDSIIYRCNANIILHDLRNNRVDDSYFLLAKAYFYHNNLDTAESILQFINQAFFDQKNEDLFLIGSNLNPTSGISNVENERFFENKNIRNESLVWLSRIYNEMGENDKALSLLNLLETDKNFPKRLYNFLNENIAYTYYKTENYEKCIDYLLKALPNAIDQKAKIRWFYLLAQLYEKIEQPANSIIWYKKVADYSNNPKMKVYSIINLIKIEYANIESIKTELLKLIKNEKFIPYLPTIYLEAAKLAIKLNENESAKNWLIQSINNNPSYDTEKQNALLLLGNLTYNLDNYLLSKISYDSVIYVNKVHKDYNKILLRKQFLNNISQNQISLSIEDSLQYLYESNIKDYDSFIKRYNRYIIDITQTFQNKKSSITEENSNTQPLDYNTFYFNSINTIETGKKDFIKKWGNRPNVDNWRNKNKIISQNIKSNIKFIDSDTTIFEDVKKDFNLPFPSNLNIPIKIDRNFNFINSISKKREYLFNMAEDFYLKLNDLEKASYYFKKIINFDQKDSISEKSIIYLTSISLYNNQLTYRDSLINILNIEYPNGIFKARKLKYDNNNLSVKNEKDLYQSAFLNIKIGNYNKFEKDLFENEKKLQKTKYYLPYQFLKVQFLLQSNNDMQAIKILDSIILNYQNEYIREKSRNIIYAIKNRNKIENYLSTLDVNKLINLYYSENIKLKDTTVIKANKDSIQKYFSFNSNETHYIGLLLKNLNSTFVKESINSINLYNSENYKNLKLESSFVILDENNFIHWIGPFNNKNESNNYLKKINLIIDKELLSFINKTKYKLFQISVSDISLVNKLTDLDLYFKLQNN